MGEDGLVPATQLPAGQGTGAPVNASYVTISAEAGLSNETLFGSALTLYPGTLSDHTGTLSDDQHGARGIITNAHALTDLSGTLASGQHGNRSGEAGTLHASAQVSGVEVTANKGVVGGYAPLVGTLVPTVNLGGAGATGTSFLRGDQTWNVPAVGGESENVVRLTGSLISTATAFADCTGLSFSVGANSDYVFEVFLIYTTAQTAVGINLGVNGPGTPTALAGRIIGYTAGTTISGKHFNSYNQAGLVQSAALAGNNFADMRGLLRNGGTAGTLILRVATEVQGTPVTVGTGSVIRWRQTF